MYRILAGSNRANLINELNTIDENYVIASTDFSVASNDITGSTYAILVRYHERKADSSVKGLLRDSLQDRRF